MSTFEIIFTAVIISICLSGVLMCIGLNTRDKQIAALQSEIEKLRSTQGGSDK